MRNIYVVVEGEAVSQTPCAHGQRRQVVYFYMYTILYFFPGNRKPVFQADFSVRNSLGLGTRALSLVSPGTAQSLELKKDLAAHMRKEW